MNGLFVVILLMGGIYIIRKVYLYIDRKNQVRTGLFDNEYEKLVWALKHFNVTPQIEDEDTQMKRLKFEYQSLRFAIRTMKGAPHSQVFLPFIYSLGVQYIDVVRGICNHFNGELPMAALEYEIDGVEGKIHIHVVAGLPSLTSNEDLLNTIRLVLNSCINLRSCFRDEIARAEAQIGNQQPSDYEYDHACNERGNAILASMDARASKVCMDDSEVTLADVDSYALASWIERCDVLPKRAVLREIVCKSDDGYSFKSTDAETIAAYRIIEPIIHQIGTDQVPTAETAEVRVTYAYDDDTDKDDKDALKRRNHLLVITLERAAVSDSVVYVRINYLLSDRKVSSALRAPISVSAKPQAGTLTMGFDLRDGKKKKAEFDFMWVDAKDKEKEGKQSEWTKEQELIHQITNPDVAYNLYWGQKLVLRERYYEATVHLEYAWKWYNEHSSDGVQPQVSNVENARICYLLGHCYFKLSQYEKAVFYLGCASSNNTNIEYHRAYLNCLITMGSYIQALRFILDEQEMVNSYIDQCNQNNQDLLDGVTEYYHYLFCCYTNICIHLKNYDRAEASCKAYLEQNAEDTFALEALARIQRLRGNNKKGKEGNQEK